MRFTLLILASFFSVHAIADVYKCTDGKGNKIYSSKPCTAGYTNSELDIRTGSSINLDEAQNLEVLKQKEQEAKLEQQKLEQQQLQQKQAQFLESVKNESAANQLLVKNNPDKFSAYAIPPYLPDKLTSLVKTYEARLPDIERLRRQAATKALESGECGRVEESALNERSTKDALMFLVDCSSAKKFYFTEQELTK